MSLRRPPSWTPEPPLSIPLDDEALRANDHGHFAGPEISLLAHGSCRGSLARPTVNEPLDGPSTCTCAVGPACELKSLLCAGDSCFPCADWIVPSVWTLPNLQAEPNTKPSSIGTVRPSPN